MSFPGNTTRRVPTRSPVEHRKEPVDEAEHADDRHVAVPAGSRAAWTAATCLSSPATRSFLTRPRTSSSSRRWVNSPPTRRTRICASLVALGVDDADPGRPDREVVDVGPTARDAPVVQRQHTPVRAACSRAATRSSPTAPTAQARVDCGSPTTAALRRTIRPRCANRSARTATRRSYSRRAAPPATPGNGGTTTSVARRAEVDPPRLLVRQAVQAHHPPLGPHVPRPLAAGDLRPATAATVVPQPDHPRQRVCRLVPVP